MKNHPQQNKIQQKVDEMNSLVDLFKTSIYANKPPVEAMWKEKKTGHAHTHTVRQVTREENGSSFTCSSSSCGTHRASLSIGKLRHCPYSKTNILYQEFVQVCGTGSKELNLGKYLKDLPFILEQD